MVPKSFSIEPTDLLARPYHGYRRGVLSSGHSPSLVSTDHPSRPSYNGETMCNDKPIKLIGRNLMSWVCVRCSSVGPSIRPLYALYLRNLLVDFHQILGNYYVPVDQFPMTCFSIFFQQINHHYTCTIFHIFQRPF